MEDVVQEAWLRALSTPPRHRENEGGWFQVVGWRLALRAASRNTRRLEWERSAAAPEATFRTPFANVAERETKRALARAVDNLREPYGRALRLRFLDDCSYSEMAERLGLSEASVRSRVKRGLEELRDQLSSRRSSFVGIGMLLLFLLPQRRRVIPLLAWTGLVTAVLALLFLTKPDARAVETAEGGFGSAEVRTVSLLARDSDSGRAPVPSRAVASPDEVAGTDAQQPHGIESLDLGGIAQDPLGEPVSNAGIWLLQDGAASLAARTDREGRYYIEDVPGDAWVWAEQAGRGASVRHAVRTIGRRQRARFDLALGYPLKPLRIRVESHAGEPVAGAEVLFLAAGGEVWGLQGTLESTAIHATYWTDEHGALDAWQSGGFAGLLVSHPAYPDLAMPFQLQALGDSCILRLPQGTELSGVVRNAAGSVVGGALVRYASLSEELPSELRHERARHETRTDDAGNFHFPNLGPGPFQLLALSEETEDGAAGVLFDQLETGVSKRVLVALDEARSLRGRVLAGEAQLAGVSVTFVADSTDPKQPRLRETVAVGDSGTFAFHGVAGPGMLYLIPPGEDRIPLDRRPAQAGEQGIELGSSAHTAPSATVRAELAFSPEESLGAWLEISGDPLAQPLRVRAESNSTAAGSWSTPPLPPGSYCLEGVVPGRGTFDAGRFTLRAGEDLDLGKIRVPQAQELHVRFRWRDPLDRKVTFTLTRVGESGTRLRKSPGTGSRRRGMQLLEDGFVIHDNLPGSYSLTVRANGLDTFRAEVVIEEGFDAEVVLPDRGESFIRIQLAAPRALESGESRSLVVVDANGRRTSLDPGDVKQRGPVAWLGRSLVPIDCRLEVSTSGGLQGSLAMSEEQIRRGRTVLLELH